jgi:outer membrane autotransporter protein
LGANDYSYGYGFVLAGANVINVDSGHENTIAGKISGTSNLELTGGGTLILDGANTYSGDTTISSGNLVISGTLGSDAQPAYYAGNIINNGAGDLVFDQGDYQIISGNISSSSNGTQGLVKLGTGTLELKGTNTYLGDTTVSAGAIKVSSDANLGESNTLKLGEGTLILDGTSFAKTITLTDSDAIIDTQNNNVTTFGKITGTNGFTKTGTGQLTLTTDSDYSGLTTVSSGDLIIRAEVADNAAFETSSSTNLIFEQTANQNVGVVSGSGNLVHNGRGTLTLTATNTYTGVTTVGAGSTLTNRGVLASNQLVLNDGASFVNVGSHQLTGTGALLTVNGDGATYVGNLNAAGATIQFNLPASVQQDLLKVTGNADISGSTLGMDVPIGVTFDLPPGEQFTVLDVAGNLKADNLTLLSTFVNGVTVLSEVGFVYDPIMEKIFGIVIPVGKAPQAKVFSEGALASMAMVADQGLTVANVGVNEAERAAEQSTTDIGAFASMTGGKVRYEAGSHIDANGFVVLAGVSMSNQLDPGRLTLGLFMEYGTGSYDTYNSFPGLRDVDGGGDTHNVGGGILGKMNFNNGAYLEGSFRYGKVHNEYDTENLRTVTGRQISFDSDSAYYGAHFGTGYVWKITDQTSLDIYGKYLWTHQEGDSVRLSNNDLVEFDDANSSRFMFGVRGSQKINDYIAPYLGLAWEYEFDGKLSSKSYGISIGEPSLKGATGIGELGLTISPSPNHPINIDLGIRGVVGKRQGIAGNLAFEYNF